ncbi:MAG: radical SAM protein [Dysgonamonadaceae bacterium]|nr:radical SAM protein [Dysgonamonadaceae bacterium]
MNYKVYFKRILLRQTYIRLVYALKGCKEAIQHRKYLVIVYAWRGLLFFVKWLPASISILLKRKIYIPNIGISLTTRCTLKCRHCDHYIPTIEEKYHEILAFDSFKTQLDNLLVNADNLFELRLLGGEPLLNRNTAQMLLYSLEHPKIERVELVTNGTLDISDEIVDILKRFPKKSSVYLSNYTANESLIPLLKTDSIAEKLIANGITLNFDRNLLWSKTEQIQRHFRSAAMNKRYFMECLKLTHCMNIRGGKLFICPRAATFSLRDLYRRFFPPAPALQENKEYINLSQPVEKWQFLEFFGNDFFNACDYCSNVSEVAGEKMIPALQ